jgi:hypothetical protein
MEQGKIEPSVELKKDHMKIIYLSLLFLGLAAVSSCSSAEKPANANKPVPEIPANPPNSNTEANVQPVVIQGDNTNVPANTANVQVITPTKMTTNPGRPASDNSEIFTELKDVPIETRVFKDHPQVVKVVKAGNPGKATIKIYLKGGKVVDVPGDKFPNLSAETAASIVAAAGIKAPAVPQSKRPEDVKKPEQK